VWNYVRYRVRNADAADEVASQIFEKALAKFSSYDPGRGEFAVWLFAIARNTVRDHYRAASRREKFLSILTAGMRSSTPSPLDEVLRWEERAELLAAISSLSRRDRDLIGLKFGACLTNRRIAELSGLTESNVGVILFRAIRRLRRELEADNEKQ
jgi:RNA polymerase sigma-70 factor (ECF subfamily)